MEERGSGGAGPRLLDRVSRACDPVYDRTNRADSIWSKLKPCAASPLQLSGSLHTMSPRAPGAAAVLPVWEGV